MFPTMKGPPQVPLETRCSDPVSQFFANCCNKSVDCGGTSQRKRYRRWPRDLQRNQIHGLVDRIYGL
jgi:hypothetical protein